ncbi:hypothetical protein [Marilutibacter chinensis]|uniref:DUF4148 domain-containing protein n=1 Tax=Marilutibacter chinensis TaxID=2912247 RepID=A0ABS9HSH0_9GAMM|nr:hypothetical protein [Lysobacter chinensis]MCF7221238.1 hypothetical protein [Lysobacter chinensis]MCF7223021.1 hypothetical protein [Lysobacter chinensis]
MDYLQSFSRSLFRPALHLRTGNRSGLALIALWAALWCGVPAGADAQTIDEPGVHLVDPRSGQGHDVDARGQDKASARKPGPAGGPGPAYCAGRPGSDARPDNCIDTQVREDEARRKSIEAARRSGVEVGTHVRDRIPQRPVQRNH